MMSGWLCHPQCYNQTVCVLDSTVTHNLGGFAGYCVHQSISVRIRTLINQYQRVRMEDGLARGLERVGGG